MPLCPLSSLSMLPLRRHLWTAVSEIELPSSRTRVSNQNEVISGLLAILVQFLL
ncbi:hypothetical protein RchiOBHm_Chr5g0033721 [Rosa chinensis]|uniref:Uncharacterized protein n=1 Tax=Rosa chinensis TaxID=74649 RepID=A0A2P6QAR9_ROSCH|nr:hypothetical protein RchiOBHm_Chr5g0033721 [Rosa chinensis]